MERKFGRFAIRNLMVYFTVLFAVGFIIIQVAPAVYVNYLSLNPALILKGQIWRIFTFLIYPPSSDRLWGLLILFVDFSLGVSLERAWGTFRFNVFMFSQVIFYILASFIMYFLYGYFGYIFSGAMSILTPESMSMSLFLAFAITFPEAQFYLYFVIPVKAKYMGILYAVIEIYDFFRYPMTRVAIFLSFFTVILFFFMTRDWRKYSPKEIKRKQDYRREVRMMPESKAGTRHRCAVCGRTEKDGDDLEFRYCSKCKGNLEYCQDHLYTHQHVT